MTESSFLQECKHCGTMFEWFDMSTSGFTNGVSLGLG